MESKTITNNYLIDVSDLFLRSADAIFVLDSECFVEANPAALQLLGISDADDFPGTQVFKLIKDQKGNEYTQKEFISQLFQNPGQIRVFQIVTKFSFFWVEINNISFKKDNKNLVFSTWRDISESKQLESQFQNSEKKLNNALILANCATWEYDSTKKRFSVSEGAMDIFGLDHRFRSSEENKFIVPLEDYIDLIHPDDRHLFEKARTQIKSTTDEKFIHHLKYRIIDHSNEIKHLYATTRISIERDGNLIRYYGTVQDISEMHQMEKELTKSKEQLSDALTVANLSTWELDIKSNKMVVGDNFISMMGGTIPVKDENEVAVEDYISLIHPDDLHSYYLALDKAVKAKTREYLDFVEYRMLKPGGEIRNIYLSIKVKKDQHGNHLQHYGTIQDITPIKKAIAEKERFGKIIEATSDIVLIFDKEMNLIYLNQTAKDFYGFSPDDNVNGFPLKIIQSDHSIRLMKEEIFPTVEEKGIWNGENVIQRYDKELITVSQVVISHKGFDGEVEYYSSIVRDISQQKQIEQDLVYKNKELDTFVYKASHDLRGPITSLMGLYSVIENEIKDKKSMEYFNLYNKQIVRLNEIIITLIQLTKIKEVDIVRTAIDFPEIVESCIGSFTNLPNFENLEFDINIEVDPPFASDKGLVTTILQNLIENGIKYSKPNVSGVVKISINRNHHDDIIIKVEDQGIGIEHDIQGEVFNMFFRANNNVIGSGLGLYILKSAVEKLNGKVSLYSKVNEGTTFTVKLKNHVVEAQLAE